MKHALAKQVLLCGANQVLRGAFGWLVRESANDARGSASQLAADETSGAREFIGNGFDAGAQTVSMRIAAAAIVVQGFHSGDANRNFREPLTPWTAKTIGDDDRNREPQAIFELAMKLCGRAIRIFGQEKSVASAIDIGDVDSAVGAYESVMSFGDENAVLAAHDSLALSDGQFDYSRVEVEAARPTAGSGGGMDGRQINELSLGFGDDFVFDD